MANLTSNSPLSPLPLFIIFSLSLTFFSWKAIAKSLESGIQLQKPQREFDYFALSLQWPGTFCQKTHYCCKQNGCCRPEPLAWFTIHGLWPDYDDGTWPSCCARTEFDMEKISSLLPLLEKYWPTLTCSSTTQCFGGKGLFWAHEWGKHGTCSFPVIKDEYSYFTTALNLYFKYNITEILNNAGFSASNAEKYPLGDIVAIIKKAVGSSPEIVCKRDSVQELRICFYKDFKPRDCIAASTNEDDTLNSRSSCPRYVTLPAYAPPVLEDVTNPGAAKVTWAS